MAGAIEDEKKIFYALKDSGMTQEMIEEFMHNFYLNDKVQMKKILLIYRTKLLSDIHIEQNKLYCLDFLIRKFKTGFDKQGGKNDFK